MFEKFINFRDKHSENSVLLANYLFILYAFLLPISFDYSKDIFKIIFLLFLFSGNIKERLSFAIKNKIVQAILLFYSMYIIWLLGSNYIDVALWKLKEYKYLLFFIIYITMIKESFKEKILSAFIVAVMVSELISFSMMLNIHIPFVKIVGYGNFVPFFYSYSQYVLLISIALGLVLYKLIYQKQNIYIKIVYLLFFIGSSLNIFMLESKMGYILYILSILTVILYASKEYISKAKIIFLVILITLTYTLAFNFSSNFKSKINNIYNQTNIAIENNKYVGSTGLRIGWHVYSFELFKENPLFGIGTMNHINAMELKIENSKVSDQEKIALLKFVNRYRYGLSSLHSEYLDHIIQFGLIGLLVFLYIFYTIYKERSSNNYLGMLNILLLVFFIFYFSVNYIFVFTQLGIVFFFLTSLSVNTFYSNKLPK